jgi:acetylornithine deacetylase
MRALDILEKLVGFASVVGTPNGNIVEWIADYLKSFGIAAHILPGPEGDRANLFATIGPAGQPGYILSAIWTWSRPPRPVGAAIPFR